MSFDKVVNTSTPKEEVITIEIGGDKVEFVARELSYYKRQGILTKVHVSGDMSSTGLVVASIFDSEGKPMTAEQAEQLPSDVAEKFLNAAIRVNGLDKGAEEVTGKN